MQMLLRILACRSLAHQVRSCGGGCGGASTLRGVGLVRVRGARVEALVGARLAHVGVGARGKLGTVGIMNTSRARASKHDPSPSEDEEELEELEDVGDDWTEDEEELEEESERCINTGGLDWAELALDCANATLAECGEAMGETTLYSFKVNPRTKRVYIRLDKLRDKFGAPLLEDLTLFSRNFNARLDALEQHTDDIEIEVSSPGAERIVWIPDELERFKELPMEVTYKIEREGKPPVYERQVLSFDRVEGDQVIWHLANVRANRPDGKGRAISKKKLAADIAIPIAAITKANVHIDL